MAAPWPPGLARGLDQSPFQHADSRAVRIVDDAIEHDVGVIVMGSRGRSDLTGFILGSTAHKVIHLTDRPVLIVR